MKIGIYIECFDPAGGGAERSTLQIADELVARGHEVTLLAGNAPQHCDLGKVQLRSMVSRDSWFWWDLWRFASWARQQRETGGFDVTLSVTTAVMADVVQPRSGTMKETFARNIAMRPRSSSRQSKRLTLALSPKHRTLLALERRTIEDTRVKKYLAVSRYVVEQLTQGYAIAPQRIEVIANAATMPQLTDEERNAARRAVRQSFGITDDTPTFLFIALNARLKGFGTLVKAVARLHDQGREVAVLVAGVRKYGNVVHVAEAGVRSQFRMVGPTNSAVDLYCAADVTVHPTWYDPSSKVVIESLMLGVPAITTRFNGAADLMGCGGNHGGGEGAFMGRVLDDPGDAVALADAMTELCDPATRAACAVNRETLAEELSMKTHVDRLETVLSAVCGAK